MPDRPGGSLAGNGLRLPIRYWRLVQYPPRRLSHFDHRGHYAHDQHRRHGALHRRPRPLYYQCKRDRTGIVLRCQCRFSGVGLSAEGPPMHRQTDRFLPDGLHESVSRNWLLGDRLALSSILVDDRPPGTSPLITSCEHGVSRHSIRACSETLNLPPSIAAHALFADSPSPSKRCPL